MLTDWLYRTHGRGHKSPFVGFVCLTGIIDEPDNSILHNHIPISNSATPHLSDSAGQAEMI